MAEVVGFPSAVQAARSGKPVESLAEELLSLLSQDEQLSLLDGDNSFWTGMGDIFKGVYFTEPFIHGEVKRLGIPGIRYCDGPRGVTIKEATVFPVATARAAAWDISLEERVGQAIGLEARANGANTVGSVCINLPRHPAWGRVQETYGEDPMLLGEFGAAHVRGLQRNAMACIKHFALNSMETARFRVNVRVDEAALHEVYLPHFKRCVDEGALSVMSAYNAVNGEWSGENKMLLTDILKKHWGFEGFVISDWVFGLHDGVKSIKAGLEIEAPFQNLRARYVRQVLRSGELSWSDIFVLARRIIKTQLRHYASRVASEPSRHVVFCQQHRDLAQEVATKAIVLLKNDQINGQSLLPLDSTLSSYALIGLGADDTVTGDQASSWVDCPGIDSAFQAMKRSLPRSQVYLSNSRSVRDAVSAASKAHVAILIVGYTGEDEGEFLKPSREDDPAAFAVYPPFDDSPFAKQVQRAVATQEPIGAADTLRQRTKRDFYERPRAGDRRSVRLRSDDVDLIRAVLEVNPLTIVCVRTAGAVIIEEWCQEVPTVLIGWYNGCQGGTALADILMGSANPSGRLPWSMPTTEEHLPEFDANANTITYDKWLGQRLLDRLGVKAAYPLGYGLSYTEFQLQNATAVRHGDVTENGYEHMSVRVQVFNAGNQARRCVVQVYGRRKSKLTTGENRDFPTRVLVGFGCVEVDKGQRRSLRVKASIAPLKRWKNGRLVLDVDEVDLENGQHADDPEALTVTCNLAKPHV
jgi:beta-glucosidase-like glycosyl hydrolase